MMLKDGQLDIVVSRKTNEVAICKYILKTTGTLRAWTAHGRLYRTTIEEIMNQGLQLIKDIIEDEQADYVDDIPEIMKKPRLSISKNRFISIGVSDGEVTISPMEVKRNWAGMSKYTIKLQCPIDRKAFADALESAISDA